MRGRVRSVEPGAITVEVPGALVRGVGGTGAAVHGELAVAVHDPGEELRAGAIDVGATGKILVGGSRASAETLTRARAMGVAGIVLGGVLDKELRDFEAIQRRRREVGGLTGSFGVLLLEGFGKVGIDPQRFAWFRAHSRQHGQPVRGRWAPLRLRREVAPGRRTLPRVGERVIAHRRPFQGQAGVLVARARRPARHAVRDSARMGLVRFEDGAPGAGPPPQPRGQPAGATSLGCVYFAVTGCPAAAVAAPATRTVGEAGRAALGPRAGPRGERPARCSRSRAARRGQDRAGEGRGPGARRGDGPTARPSS